MEEIIRGTTPTIKIKFSKVNPSEITEAYLCIKQYDSNVIEKDLSSASVDGDSLSFVLSQKDTLALKKQTIASIILDYMVNGITRYSSRRMDYNVVDPGKNEVI